MSDVTRPQKDPKPGRTPITILVMADLCRRRRAGIAKYGTELKSENGRDALVDAYQEALDLVMYLRQMIEERTDRTSPPSAEMEQLTDEFRAMQGQIGISEPEYTPRALESRQTAREFIASHPSLIKEILSDPSLVVAPGRFFPVPDDFPRPNETILEEAQRLVHGDRGEAYGHPIFDMTRTADMLTALFRDKLRIGVQLEAEDVAQAMICVKQSRERNKPKRDNNTDTAGYAETKQMIKEWREAHPDVDPRDCY